MLPISGGLSFKIGEKLKNLSTENFSSPSHIYLDIPSDYKLYVNVGEKIKSGQSVAFPDNNNLLPIVSSVSGIIESFNNNTIVVKNDFKETIFATPPIKKHLNEIKSSEIESTCRELCILDNGIPLFKKLRIATGKIENVIINCTNPDPCSAINIRIVAEQFEKLIYGLKVLIHFTKARLGIIAIDETLDYQFPNLDKNISDKKLILLRVIENKYPSSNEKILLHALTRREYQNDNIIKEGRTLIVSPEAVVNLYDGLVYGIPQTKKLITISGGVKNNKNIFVPFGTKVSDIIEFCGGLTKEDASIIANGFMSGFEVNYDSTIMNYNSLTAISVKATIEHKCIHCGKCLQVCPMLLKPMHIYNNILNSQNDRNTALGAEHCIGCGCCSYICPSNIPLSKIIFNSQAKPSKIGEESE